MTILEATFICQALRSLSMWQGKALTMAPPLALLAVLMVTGLQGQSWVGGAPPGCRMLQGCALLSGWGWVGPGQGVRTPGHHGNTSSFTKAQHAPTISPALGHTGSQKGPGSPLDALGRCLTCLLPKFSSKFLTFSECGPC